MSVLKTWEELSNIYRGREGNERGQNGRKLLKSLPGGDVSNEEVMGKVAPKGEEEREMLVFTISVSCKYFKICLRLREDG